MGIRKRSWVAAAVLLFGTAAAVGAEGESARDQWKFKGEVYLWGASIKGDTNANDPIDIEFRGLLKNLDFAFMGTFAASKDKWTLFTDLVYLDVEDDYKSTANIIGRPIETKVDVELEGFITTLWGAYTFPETENTALQGLAGARYLWIEVDMAFDIGNRKVKTSPSGHVWDGVVGMRGTTQLNDKWYLAYYGDVGTGESDLTWQALAAINYRFKKVDAVFGYRYLRWNFDEGTSFGKEIDDLYLSGPFAGVKFRF